MNRAAREPIVKCKECRGEGVQAGPFGPRACSPCNGSGLRALEPIEKADTIPPTKMCRCCGVAYDAETWRALQYVGAQDDGDGGFLELRNCPCGSTLSLEAA